jgi:uncharacterized repeat protein (TIGR03803 family)
MHRMRFAQRFVVPAFAITLVAALLSTYSPSSPTASGVTPSHAPPGSASSALAADVTGRTPVSTATSVYNYSFDTSRGKGLVSNLIADPQGDLYGTTQEGGAYNAGTVFQLTPPGKGKTAWTQRVLYSFCQRQSCKDGSYPAAGLVFAKQTNNVVGLFGTTEEGGESGSGTVFRLLPSATGKPFWTEAVLHSFAGGSDGADPRSHLIADTSGALVLYGTTNGGGTGGDCGSGGCGTVFELTPPNKQHPIHWAETVLHSFAGGNDGEYTTAGVIEDAQHKLYGTTYQGGSAGYGTIFMLSPPAHGGSGWTQTVLHSFLGDADGANPETGLLLEPGGSLYGTTDYGGANCYNDYGCGTIFKLVPPDKYVPSWTFNTLHSFDYFDSADGEYPLGDLIFGKDGAIYGTTEYGGTPVGTGTGPCDFLYPCGVIFKLSGVGLTFTFSIIYKFCTADTGCPVGANPTAGLTRLNGALYGTTSYAADGDACGCGAIFKLTYPSYQSPPTAITLPILPTPPAITTPSTLPPPPTITTPPTLPPPPTRSTTPPPAAIPPPTTTPPPKPSS